MEELLFHPLSDLFLLSPNEEVIRLAQDIKANGLKEPIVMYEGGILDGRNRYRVCTILNITPYFTNYNGSTPVKYLIETNLKTKRLSDSQRSVIADKIAIDIEHKFRNIQRSLFKTEIFSVRNACDLLNVSTTSLARVRKLRRNRPELLKEIEDGTNTINKVYTNSGLNTSVNIRDSLQSVSTANNIKEKKIKRRCTPGHLPLSLLSAIGGLKTEIEFLNESNWRTCNRDVARKMIIEILSMFI